MARRRTGSELLRANSEGPPPSTGLKHGPSGFVFSGLYPLEVLAPRRVQKGSPWREAMDDSTIQPVTGGRDTATKSNGKFFATILALVLGALALSGCGALGRGKVLVLANIGWDENVALSNLTKVVLQEDLGYERVDIDTSDELDSTYARV